MNQVINCINVKKTIFYRDGMLFFLQEMAHASIQMLAWPVIVIEVDTIAAHVGQIAVPIKIADELHRSKCLRNSIF
jgi:hypothetical protein